MTKEYEVRILFFGFNGDIENKFIPWENKFELEKTKFDVPNLSFKKDERKTQTNPEQTKQTCCTKNPQTVNGEGVVGSLGL